MMANPFGQAPIRIEQFVAEWCVEDRQRYDAVIKKDFVEQPYGVFNRRDPAERRPQIITAVLEVPLPDVERVTTALRGRGQNRHPTYLLNCADAARANVELRRQVDVLTMALNELRDLAVGGNRVVDDALAIARHQVNNIWNALAERSVDVAAKLLVNLPPEPGSKW